MGAYEVANGLENAAVARLKAIYESALRTALRRQHAFLAQIKAIDEGKIKPPQWYVDRDKEKEWREGFTRELLRKNKVIEGIMEDLNAVGGDAADIIREFTCDVYDVTRKETIEILSHEAAQMGVNPSFATYNKRQIGVLIRDAQSPFSKLAYANLGKNVAVRRRLQNEMAQAAILGESQQKLVKRIQAVTGQLTWQAKRVAQTERTRVQSQATYELGMEAKNMGIKVYYKWNTRMVNSRDTHIALNGKKTMVGDRFPGSILRFPGDPNAPASEVINCHCAVEEHVLLPDEELGDDGKVISAESLKDAPEHGKIAEKTNGTERNGAVHYVGTIDKRMFKAISQEIVGDDVIITDERIIHSNEHQNAFDKYQKYLPLVLSDPDFIFLDKKPNTGILIREIVDEGTHMQLVLRLHVSSDNPDYKNSIISYWNINESRRKNYQRNKAIVYKRGDL